MLGYNTLDCGSVSGTVQQVTGNVSLSTGAFCESGKNEAAFFSN